MQRLEPLVLHAYKKNNQKHGAIFSTCSITCQPEIRPEVQTVATSMFCGRETVDTNIDSLESTKHTAFPRSQSISILLYTKSQRNEKNKANFIQKYLTYFINFQKNANHKTFAVFGGPKVACSLDGARDFFRYSPANNALSLSRADARETV